MLKFSIEEHCSVIFNHTNSSIQDRAYVVENLLHFLFCEDESIRYEATGTVLEKMTCSTYSSLYTVKNKREFFILVDQLASIKGLIIDLRHRYHQISIEVFYPNRLIRTKNDLRRFFLFFSSRPISLPIIINEQCIPT